MEGSRDIALIRNEKKDVKMNIPCSQKPRVLSKPRSIERSKVQSKHFGAAFSHLPVGEAPDFSTWN